MVKPLLTDDDLRCFFTIHFLRFCHRQEQLTQMTKDEWYFGDDEMTVGNSTRRKMKRFTRRRSRP